MKKQPKEEKNQQEAWKQEKEQESTSLHTDVERKHEELKNSTIGGF
jgi:hypothetical protein